MKDFFKPEDFKMEGFMSTSFVTCAEIANEKFNKLIESWPVVYGFEDESGIIHFSTNAPKHSADSHQGRLAFIEEIKKEPCEHKPQMIPTVAKATQFVDLLCRDVICIDCGVELQATWSEKK